MLHLIISDLLSVIVYFQTYLFFLFFQGDCNPFSLFCMLECIHQIIVSSSFQIHAISVHKAVLFDFLLHLDLIFLENCVIA